MQALWQARGTGMARCFSGWMDTQDTQQYATLECSVADAIRATPGYNAAAFRLASTNSAENSSISAAVVAL